MEAGDDRDEPASDQCHGCKGGRPASAVHPKRAIERVAARGLVVHHEDAHMRILGVLTEK